ncbi:MAG: 2,3,4,5-tetrahydropyridine-2,6-dicarboxylate N-succinyltransferase [Bacteroidota bacterium]
MTTEAIIEAAWLDRSKLSDQATIKAIETVIEGLDQGKLSVVEQGENFDEQGRTTWKVNEWVKKAVILYFPIRQMQVIESGPFEYHDKMKLKTGYRELGVRVVPPATVRYGAFVAPGVVLMPSYINIGAYVDSGTMVDTWATVGSCARIGKNVHLSGGVGIGGVLEPLQASPVIVEDGAFIGSRSILVEGVHVGKEAVIGAGVTLTGSSRIIDVSGPEPKEYRGYVPPRSVVIPGSLTKSFPAGDYQVPCALIIGERKESTDWKTALNSTLRDFSVTIA